MIGANKLKKVHPELNLCYSLKGFNKTRIELFIFQLFRFFQLRCFSTQNCWSMWLPIRWRPGSFDLHMHSNMTACMRHSNIILKTFDDWVFKYESSDNSCSNICYHIFINNWIKGCHLLCRERFNLQSLNNQSTKYDQLA